MHETAQAATEPKPAQGYAVAALPDPYRILGLRLKPFCLGHYLLLQRFNCAFVASEPQPITREDVLLGVLICSMWNNEFLEFISGKGFWSEVRKWGKRVGIFDLTAKAGLFQRYLDESLHEPEYIEINSGEGTGEWSQNVKMTLMTRLHYDEQSALNMPLSKALAEYYKLAESEGLIRLLTPEDAEEIQTNNAALDALKNLMGEQCPA